MLQSLVIKKLNALLRLQADFTVSHSYNTNAGYLPPADCSEAQPRSSFQNFINKINLCIIKSLYTQCAIVRAKYNLTANN